MVTLHVASTAALSTSFLSDVRALLDSAFERDFTDEDWDHAVGGVHVWVSASPGVISHGSLVERTLVCSGDTLRVGYRGGRDRLIGVQAAFQASSIPPVSVEHTPGVKRIALAPRRTGFASFRDLHGLRPPLRGECPIGVRGGAWTVRYN